MITVSIRSRFRPLWRWYGARLAARLHLTRLSLLLLPGVRFESQIDGGPWETIGKVHHE